MCAFAIADTGKLRDANITAGIDGHVCGTSKIRILAAVRNIGLGYSRPFIGVVL
ncbi:hypothetical protein O9992_10270 [Vibrio lentus]|nr:hypothetical protein [Vibrio lentus]